MSVNDFFQNLLQKQSARMRRLEEEIYDTGICEEEQEDEEAILDAQ